MKIEIAKQDLLEAVNKVKSVVPPRTALPILSHILFEAENGQLRLSATDLKVGVECTVDCKVDEEGALTVLAQRLASVLPELPDRPVSITLGDSNSVVLECGRIQTKLLSMAPDEFPPVQKFDEAEPIVLQQVSLKRLFEKTSFAIGADQGRYHLTGLLCEIEDGKFTTVATDSRRLSLCVERENIPNGVAFKVIIPGKMIHELERLLSGEGEVKVYIAENKAGFEFDSLRFVTALIDGDFPNYRTVLPKKHDKEAVLDRAEFMDAVRRSRTMTSSKWNNVRFQINAGELVLKVATPDIGEHREELPIEYEGAPVEISFNPDYVFDVLRRIESEKVSLVFKDHENPGLLKPQTEAPEEDYLNVIMPIRF